MKKLFLKIQWLIKQKNRPCYRACYGCKYFEFCKRQDLKAVFGKSKPAPVIPDVVSKSISEAIKKNAEAQSVDDYINKINKTLEEAKKQGDK